MQRDGTRQVNNPLRVPDTVTAIDGPQAGAPRIIHPVAIRVGTSIKETAMPLYTNAESDVYEVPESGVYTDDNGNPFQFVKGHRMSHAEAARFSDFRAQAEGDTVPGLTAARVGDEQPAVAETDEPIAELRAEGSAPENRMESAPSNRKSAKA